MFCRDCYRWCFLPGLTRVNSIIFLNHLTFFDTLLNRIVCFFKLNLDYFLVCSQNGEYWCSLFVLSSSSSCLWFEWDCWFLSWIVAKLVMFDGGFWMDGFCSQFVPLWPFLLKLYCIYLYILSLVGLGFLSIKMDFRRRSNGVKSLCHLLVTEVEFHKPVNIPVMNGLLIIQLNQIYGL